MSTNDRIKRPHPERTRPIRAWSTLFGSAESDGGSLGDVVSRSVDLGYRVVDDYIRQGQRAAQRFSERAYGPEAMVSDAQEMAGRMTQYASELMGVWLEFMDAASNAGAARRTASGNGASSGTSSAPITREHLPAERVPVRIEIASRRPTEVEIDLRPSRAGAPLLLHGLRAADPSTPRLTDVALQPPRAADEPWRLRVSVPDSHPAGLYSGVIVDERTSMTVGTVRVRVIE